MKILYRKIILIGSTLLLSCTFTPTEVDPINGKRTYSITSNRLANQDAGNSDSVEEALLDLENEAVPLYMETVCGIGPHKIVSRSKPIIEAWTGGGGGWFVKRTFLAQCI